MKVLKIVLAALLLLCLAHMPYGYYLLIRWVALVVFAYIGYDYYQRRNNMEQGLRRILFSIRLKRMESERQGVSSIRCNVCWSCPTSRQWIMWRLLIYEDMNNAVLIRAILGDLNCQYDENENGSIFFVYQGESFWVSASENSVWIRIIDMRENKENPIGNLLISNFEQVWIV